MDQFIKYLGLNKPVCFINFHAVVKQKRQCIIGILRFYHFYFLHYMISKECPSTTSVASTCETLSAGNVTENTGRMIDDQSGPINYDQ